MTTEELSHEAHAGWFEKRYATEDLQELAIESWKNDQKLNTINYWLHKRLFDLTLPFTKDVRKTWLTVGDGYGFDAQYFLKKGLDVTATDISGTFLPLAQKHHFINKFSIENVEKLSFGNDSFDYIFCKEAYHHFPRPYLGVYEMIRVAREAVILIEPHDPLSKMPLLLGLRNILDRIDTKLLHRVWKNRYSFEEVGNYVFKLSEREIDKLANGIGLPMVAFKGINNNYYHPSIGKEKANQTSKVFKRLLLKIKFHDMLTFLGLMPAQVLCAVIFKQTPSKNTIANLLHDGFQIHYLPENPYAKTPTAQ